MLLDIKMTLPYKLFLTFIHCHHWENDKNLLQFGSLHVFRIAWQDLHCQWFTLQLVKKMNVHYDMNISLKDQFSSIEHQFKYCWNNSKTFWLDFSSEKKQCINQGSIFTWGTQVNMQLCPFVTSVRPHFSDLAPACSAPGSSRFRDFSYNIHVFVPYII